jgi:hypothetical protein
MPQPDVLLITAWRRQDGGHDFPHGPGLRWAVLPLGEQQVRGTDQCGRERVDVGVGCDPAKVALGRQGPNDHGRALADERESGGAGRAQPPGQLVPGDDEDHDRHHDRIEAGHRSAGQIVRDDTGPGRVPQGGGLGLDPRDAVQYQLGEEGVKVSEVPM